MGQSARSMWVSGGGCADHDDAEAAKFFLAHLPASSSRTNTHNTLRSIHSFHTRAQQQQQRVLCYGCVASQ